MSHALPIAVPEPGIATLQVASPAHFHLDRGFAHQLIEACGRVRCMPELKAIVLVAEGRHFSGGASQRLLETLCGSAALGELITLSLEALIELPVPSIAAMQGHALGGGLLLGLWCDFPLLAEESLYGANFMQLGLTPGMGATRLLESYVGVPLARELLYTGALVKGREIQAAGAPLSRYVAPRREVAARALSLARSLCEVPRSALCALKEEMSRQRLELLRGAVAAESRLQQALLGDPLRGGGLARPGGVQE